MRKKYRLALFQKTTRGNRTEYSFLRPLPAEEERRDVRQTYGRFTLGSERQATDSEIRFTLLSRSLN